MLRVGVVGCGKLAREVHLRLLSTRAEVIALADSSEAALASAAPLAPRAEQCAKASELIAFRPDAVVIAASTELHAAIGMQVAAAGIPFYLEKPIATNLPEARRLLAAVGEQEVKAAAGFNLRFLPAHIEARRLLQAGAIGRVIAVRSVFTSDAPLPGWKESRASGGGALLDLFSHDADLLPHLLDSRIESVSARLASRATDDDTAWVDCRFDCGALAQCFVAFGMAPQACIEIHGERGRIVIDRYNSVAPQVVTSVRGAVGHLVDAVREFLDAVPTLSAKARAPWNDLSYAPALDNFLACVRDNRPVQPSIHDGMASLAVVLAAEESARSGAPISIPLPRGAAGFSAEEAAP